MLNSIVKFCATFCYVGTFPFASGTMASAAGVVIYFLLYAQISAYILVTVGITVVGFLVAGRMEKILNKKDPSWVVIDEVSGILITLFLLPPTIPVIVTAFFVFRAFDMFKIYPANKWEAAGGGTGIMMDDIIAGLYANIVMQVALQIINV
ncbi:MAG TPA: phosphatidylglycerophosphatase A [Candidatus Omnitrophota bacterium]|nr:phosphatidylglycerophosphatase A [Candidatus Omnitrophota bacterium]HPD85072.1 phosphatidylglycerophosphatase A [Candidatus Omnitrophota bacterium]HRZ03930.1 phosphatidylglycerophosphatase A [Candidatus Omnitrophota bacterium]